MRYDPTLDHVAVVTAARTAPGRPPLGAPLTPQEGAEVCAVAACLLRARGEDACLLGGKTPAQNHGVIQGQRVAVDILCYPSTGAAWDCLVDDGRWVAWQAAPPLQPGLAFALACETPPDPPSPSPAPPSPSPTPPATDCPCRQELGIVLAQLASANDQRQAVLLALARLTTLVAALPTEAALRESPLPVRFQW